MNAVDVIGQFITAVQISEQRVGHGFGGQHAGLHRGVAAFDLGEVQGAEVAADQRAALEDHFRQRVQAALADGARAVADALAAFQVLC